MNDKSIDYKIEKYKSKLSYYSELKNQMDGGGKTTNFLCNTHYNPSLANTSTGTWMKISPSNIVPNVTIKCDFPGCPNTISSTSPPNTRMWAYFPKDRKGRLVNSLVLTHPGWSSS